MTSLPGAEVRIKGEGAADPQQMLQEHCIYLQSGKRVCCSGVFGHSATPWLHVTQL